MSKTSKNDSYLAYLVFTCGRAAGAPTAGPTTHYWAQYA